MAYAAWSVVAGEQPTASKWNILGTNDASFNDGTGIGTSVIDYTKLAKNVAAGVIASPSSGNNVVTGIGFQPRVIIIFSQFQQAYSSTHHFSTSYGVYDRIAGTQSCVYGNISSAGGGGTRDGSNILHVDAALGTNQGTASISATTTDGFTLNFSAGAAPGSCPAQYTCFA